MNCKQNEKINQVKETTLVVGIDIGSTWQYARAFDWRGIELSKVFKFSNSNGRNTEIMIYITGDTHGDFERVEVFCQQMNTTVDDILIILGDAGINYYGYIWDHERKKEISKLPITLFCIHGNHEQRPEKIMEYYESHWHGGRVYVEDEFPNILFAKDGEIYDFAGLKTIVIGGAYSVDKYYRVARNWGWWSDEQPSAEIKAYVERQLKECSWKVDLVLSHTVPVKYEPTEVFLEGLDQSTVDKSTEEWLGEIEAKLNYRKWYAGHYHTEKKIDKLEIMFNNFDCIN